MVKSKKLSRGSLAVLLLALMLALSMVVGITGAWFTDAKEQSIPNQTFGTIQIGIDGANPLAATYTNTNVSGAGQVALPMPGSSVSLDGKFANLGTADAYVLYDVKVVDIKDASGTAMSAADAAALWNRTDEEVESGYMTVSDITCSNLAAVTGDAAHKGFFKAAAGQSLANVNISISISKELPNKYQGAKFTLSIGIYAIQQANMTNGDAGAYTQLRAMTEANAARTVGNAWVTYTPAPNPAP